MGIYDRDYYRNPPRRGFGSFSMVSVTTWIILINVAVFILDAILLNRRIAELFPGVPRRIVLAHFPITGPLEQWGHYSVDTVVYHFEAWRLITYQFLHASVPHLLFNMLGLYFFGPIVEGYLGRARYVAFYLLCGCSGAVVYTLLHFAGAFDVMPSWVPLVGASAAIYGVLIAGAVLAPDVTVMLLFPPIPMQLKYLALIMVGIAAYTAFTNGRNAGGEAAHLGGAVLGFVLMRYGFPGNPFKGFTRRRTARRTPRGAAFTDWSKETNR